jgi:CHAT domain-containing protein
MRSLIATAVFLLSVQCLAARPAVDDRLAGAATLICTGRGDQARVQIHKALESYRVESNGLGEGMALLLLGYADVAANRPVDAMTNLESGAVELEQAGDAVSAVIGLWMMAEVQKATGNVDGAIATYDRALALLQRASSPSAPFTLDGFMLLAPATGMDVAPLGLIRDNPKIMKPMMLMLLETILRDSLGEVLLEADHLDRAETELTRAAMLAQMFGGMFDSNIEAHLGELQRRLWHFDEARDHFRKALEGVTTISAIPGRDEWERVTILGRLAEIELLGGCTEEALAWNDRALSMVRSSKNLRRESSVLQARGDLLMRSSRFSEAEAAFDDALAAAELLGDRAQQASVLADLGQLHIWRGEYGTSAALLEKSIALFQNEKHPEEEAAAWIALAGVYSTFESPAAVRQTVEKATVLARNSNFRFAKEVIAIFEAAERWSNKGSSGELVAAFSKWWELPDTREFMLPDDVRALFDEIANVQKKESGQIDTAKVTSAHMPTLSTMSYLIDGKRLFFQGDTVGARSLWLKALDANPNKDVRAALLTAIGATYWNEERRKEAVHYFELAAQAIGTTLRDLKSEELLAGYLGSTRQWVFSVTIEALVAEGRIEDAFDHTESARARAFLMSIGNARLQPAHGTASGLVREAEALRRSIAAWERQSLFASKQTAGDLQHARERYQALVTRLKAADPEYASLTTIEPLRAADVRKILPEDTALVSFFVIGERAHVWIVDRSRMDYVMLKADRTRLDRAVCWAKGLGAGSDHDRSMTPNPSDCAAAATSEEVYDLLFAPLRGKIHAARLILVPHADLHYIPFAALRDPQTKHYLLEDYTLSYSPSASALKYLHEKESAVGGKALVIGNPDVEALPEAALPGAAREAASIARLFGTEPKLGPAATEGLLYGLGGKYDLIHICAHGEYRPDNPLFSRIVLAKDSAHDGNLDVQKILSEVDLTGVNLVVLSACESGRGKRSGGDEIVGLTRAVLYAGAPGVIATLWKIDDAAAADLMEEFYRRLLGGALAADALGQAQLSLLRRAPYADPRFWAAFELSGNPQGRWH